MVTVRRPIVWSFLADQLVILRNEHISANSTPACNPGKLLGIRHLVEFARLVFADADEHVSKATFLRIDCNL